MTETGIDIDSHLYYTSIMASEIVVKEFSPADIRALRLKLGSSQRAFARQVGVSQKAVNFWEAGQRVPNFQSYKKLLKLELEQKS